MKRVNTRPRTITNAPESYDYGYTRTICAGPYHEPYSRAADCRIVEHDGEDNAEAQRARYGSGLYVALPYHGSIVGPTATMRLVAAVRDLVDTTYIENSDARDEVLRALAAAEREEEGR